jgi:hypothetical protein
MMPDYSVSATFFISRHIFEGAENDTETSFSLWEMAIMIFLTNIFQPKKLFFSLPSFTFYILRNINH